MSLAARPSSTGSRVEQVLARMTLAEKVEQLQVVGSYDGVEFKVRPADPDLGIPNMMWGEGLHGVRVWPWHEDVTPTSFPQALALGSTWDPDLVERVAAAVATESRAMGIHHTFSPVVDVARDPRFGRIEETFGEDPHLVSRLGVAFIHGLQGRGDRRFDGDHVLATAKHFAGYHEGARGINGGAADISERTLREVHLPPFEAAVREAAVASVMPAHTDIGGVPCHANRRLLTEVLREEWGFDGFIVSDNRDVSRLKLMHAVADSFAEAAALALWAGVDQEISLNARDVRCFGEPLIAAVESGLVDEAEVDAAVRRVLRAKTEIGLFDSAGTPPDLTVLNSEPHRRLALEAARKATILLKNEGALLPLDIGAIGTVAVIGPNAAARALGGYTGDNPVETVSVLTGLRRALDPSMVIHHVEGCDLLAPGREGFAAAVAAAASADVAVVVLGDSEETCSEGVDRDTLRLPGEQQPLLEAVVAVGTPVVVVLLNGRPPDLSWAAEHVPSILECWYLGVEGGRAIAEILTGACNPSGKLTVSFPRSVGQLPVTYLQRASFTGSGGGEYLDSDKSPLFPFGHGLSYSRFSYSDIRVEPPRMTKDETAIASVDLTNVGDVLGDEVVQLYIRDDVASVTRPLLELKGFHRVTLSPGERRTVSFEVGPTQLAMFDADFRRVVEEGSFTVMIGSSSTDHLATKLEIN